MKLNIEKFIVDLWQKIDSVDKKAFVTLFIIFNIIFLYNSVLSLFGDHDWSLIYERINIQEATYAGRFATCWVEYLLTNGNHIHLYTNTFAFAFLSLAAVLILNYWKLKKTTINYLICGLFITTTPFLFSMFYYRVITFSFSMIPMFILIFLFFIEYLNNKENPQRKRIFCYILSILILTIFIFGVYQVAIGTILTILFGKILINYIDNNFKNLKQILFEQRYALYTIIISGILHLFIYAYLSAKGIVNLNFYTFKIIPLQNIGEYFITFIKHSILNTIYATYPYIGLGYKIFILFIIAISIFLIIKNIFSNKNYKVSEKIINILKFTSLYLSIFFLGRIIFFISGALIEDIGIFRLEYWSTSYFYLLSAVLCIKYGTITIKDICLILFIFLININIRINLEMQKAHMLIQEVEYYKQEKIIDLILSNENYDKDKSYTYYQIGINTDFFRKIYNSSTYYLTSELNIPIVSNGGEANALRTYGNDLGIKINNSKILKLSDFKEDTKKNRKINYFYQFMKEYHLLFPISTETKNATNTNQKIMDLYLNTVKKPVINDALRNFIINEAEPFTSEKSILIDNDKIYIIMDENILEEIKKEYKN